jgi:hypothetical protein
MLAAEAAVWLSLAGLALRCLSFAQVVRLVARPAVRPITAPKPGEAVRIGWAVDAATHRAPWRVLCFERGLAAFFMLRLRRRTPTLLYGARNDDSRGPSAHVWVQLGGQDVVGGEESAAFAVLATFPSRGACIPPAPHPRLGDPPLTYDNGQDARSRHRKAKDGVRRE